MTIIGETFGRHPGGTALLDFLTAGTGQISRKSRFFNRFPL
jgi:hypothetical protein